MKFTDEILNSETYSKHGRVEGQGAVCPLVVSGPHLHFIFFVHYDRCGTIIYPLDVYRLEKPEAVRPVGAACRDNGTFGRRFKKRRRLNVSVNFCPKSRHPDYSCPMVLTAPGSNSELVPGCIR